MSSQREKNYQDTLISDVVRTPQVGDVAPRFYGVTTKGEVHFPEDFLGKWVVFFSHQSDFSPISTTEYMEFANAYQTFMDHNIELVGISNDSVYSHIAWFQRIRELSWHGIKFADVSFPVVEDTTMEISKLYGMIKYEENKLESTQNVFILDEQNEIRAILKYPNNVGRNIDEILRIVLALQKAEKDDVLIPSGWNLGDDVILKNATDMKTATERTKGHEANRYCLDWFLCFLQEKKQKE